MMDEPRPPYDTEPGQPTMSDYYATLDAIDSHGREAGHHLAQMAALLKEAREMLSMWKKTNDANVSAMTQCLGAFKLWDNPADADYDNYDELVALRQFADRVAPMPCPPQSGGTGGQNDEPSTPWPDFPETDSLLVGGDND